jgi:nucleoid DNA-binding protein
MKKTTTVTREKIAENLKNHLGFSTPICDSIISHTFSAIIDLTKQDNKTVIKNFGTWKINNKQTRPGFNIHKGSSVNIEPRSVLRLIPSKSLKEKIKGHGD